MVVTELTWQTWDALIVSGLMTGGFKGSKMGLWVVTDRATNSVLASLRVVGLTESLMWDSRIGTGHTDNSELNTLGGCGPADRSKLGALIVTGADSSLTEAGKTDNSKTDSLRETGLTDISVTEPGLADNSKSGSLVKTGQT